MSVQYYITSLRESLVKWFDSLISLNFKKLQSWIATLVLKNGQNIKAQVTKVLSGKDLT